MSARLLALASLVLFAAVACGQPTTSTAPAPLDAVKPLAAPPPVAELEPDAGGPTCEYGGKTYQVGDQYQELEGCNKCSCGMSTGGRAVTACTDKPCPKARLTEPTP